MPPLELSPHLRDATPLAPVFARHGRLHIPDLLPAAAAQALHEDMDARTPWRRNLHAGEGGATLPLETYGAQPAEWGAEVERTVRGAAADGFSYQFDSYPISDEAEVGRRAGLAAEAVYDFLNAAPTLAWLRALTGTPAIAYCDAQATRYLPGHFLTQHDDDVAGKHRLFAYVLNLTPMWRPDWGGLLLFTDTDGHVAEGYTPAFNALNLFRVPQPRLVSEVASYAPAPRLAITGWVRSRRD